MLENVHNKRIYDMCRPYVHAYVLIHTIDGWVFDGIITGLDEKHLSLAVPLYKEGSPRKRRGRSEKGTVEQIKIAPPKSYSRFQKYIIPLPFLATITLLPWYEENRKN